MEENKTAKGNHPPFSDLMSVYKNDNPEWLREAVESVSVQQTVRPDEVLLVIDGPVPDSLRLEILRLEREISSVRVAWQTENRGLGLALRKGMELVSHELVARMDSDDISLPDRFEKQLRTFDEDPTLNIVGTQISEFIGEPGNIVGKREVPCSNEEILTWLRGRCPLNHVSVMALRSNILSVGNYIDWHFNEDYYLWIRMALAGCRFANLPDVLVNVRVGKEMYSRRGGWKYFKSEEGLQRYMLNHQIIGLPRYIYNTLGRFVIQVVMPNSIRGWIFRKLFRKQS